MEIDELEKLILQLKESLEDSEYSKGYLDALVYIYDWIEEQ